MSQIGRNAPCPCGSGRKYKMCCAKTDISKPHTGEDAVLVCMPSRGQVCYETMLALQRNLSDVKHCFLTIGRRPISEARNMLAKHALTVKLQNPFDFEPRQWFVLWIDDDSWWPAGAVSTMLPAFYDRPDVDAVFGKFGGRHPFSNVLAFRDRNDWESFPKIGVNCAPGELFPVQRAGFHWVLMRLSLLERIGEKPFDTPEGSGLGEDIAFCDRACAIGAKLVVAEGCPIVHIDADTGAAYLPGMSAMQMDENGVKSGGSTTIPVRKYGLSIDTSMADIHHQWQVELQKRQAVSRGELS